MPKRIALAAHDAIKKLALKPKRIGAVAKQRKTSSIRVLRLARRMRVNSNARAAIKPLSEQIGRNHEALTRVELAISRARKGSEELRLLREKRTRLIREIVTNTTTLDKLRTSIK